jgi:hypothetical protein
VGKSQDEVGPPRDPQAADLEAELEEIRKSRRKRWRWWPAIPLVGVGILLVIGVRLTLIRTRQRAMIRLAAAEATAFDLGAVTFRRDVGVYPPDDITVMGGSARLGGSEVLVHHLMRRFMTKAGMCGPYVSVRDDRLSDEDGDGFEEFRDPWGGVYVYAQRTPAPGETPPRFFDIASPGPDGVLGGTMVPGKGYVPATTPAGKAVEEDNVTNW